MLNALGNHKVGKSCLYVKRLSEVKLTVLRCLLAATVAELKRKYP